jgi:hypothetical protein
MISANELRIGNLIRRKSNGSYCIVNWGIIRDFDLGEDINDYEPVTLSADILVKCGFTKLANCHWSWQHPGKEHRITVEFKYYPGPYDYMQLQLFVGEGWEYTYGEKIQYLHRLQNLYFALTGEELKVNL